MPCLLSLPYGLCVCVGATFRKAHQSFNNNCEALHANTINYVKYKEKNNNLPHAKKIEKQTQHSIIKRRGRSGYITKYEYKACWQN